MAIPKGNVGEVAVVRDSKMFHGILPWKVLAFNPNMEQLQALGINFQEEPEYRYEPEVPEGAPRAKGLRLDVWMEAIILLTGEPLRAKASFYLENQYRVSQNGSVEYLNAFNQNAWGTSDTAPDFKWFKNVGVRKAFVGEEQLATFIMNWINVDRNVEFSLETFEKIVEGDLTELLGLLPVYGEKNRVRALLTVTEREGKAYHTVFTRFFARWNEESFTRWDKFFKKDPRNEPKNAVWSYAVEEYKPLAVKPDNDSPPDTDSQPGTAASKPARKW